jgi:type IV pilus assembly protein PilV
MSLMNNKLQSGFSLLEVMISVLVLAIGLLGLTALQAQGLRGGSGAHMRAQATLLAYDMMERLRADFDNARMGSYNLAMAEEPPLAGEGVFTDDEIRRWMEQLADLLPAADGAVNCDNVGICTVTIQWDESRAAGEEGAIQTFRFTTQI